MSTPLNPRRVSRLRQTGETRVSLTLDLDGSGQHSVSTGLGFLDHMLATLARFSKFDLELEATGDLHVDDHHTVEDVALSLGAAVDEALRDRKGIARFGHAYAPLDEALARVVIDLSGRPSPQVDLGLKREAIGAVATENLTHFFQSFAVAARASLHVDVLKGDNDHHRVEAAFKAFALAIRVACARDGAATVPSEKGVL